jgi:hypothetical protein
VPLGAEHIQPAEGDDLFVLLGHRAPGLLDRLGPRGLEVLRRVDRRQSALVQLEVGEELGVPAEHDVGTAARHVRRDGHGALAPCLGHDRCLTLVVLGVQHLVRHASPLEHPGQHLGLLDADGADQHRLPDVVPF